MAGSAINLQGCFDHGWIVDGCPQFAYPNRISIEVPVSAGKGLELLDSNPPAWPVRFRNVLSSNSVGRTQISHVLTSHWDFGFPVAGFCRQTRALPGCASKAGT